MGNKLLFFILLLLLIPVSVVAHPLDKALVEILKVENSKTIVNLRVSAQYLAERVDLDLNGDGEITWEEAKKRNPARELEKFLKIDSNCLGSNSMDVYKDPMGYSLQTSFSCDKSVKSIQTVGLPQTLVRIKDKNEKVILISGDSKLEIDTAKPLFTNFIKEGFWHIFTGADHLAFLLTLAMAPFLFGGQIVLKDIVKRIFILTTAFTISHSITLVAASQHWIVASSRIFETIIALSIAATALNNLLKLVAIESLWQVVFFFGLFHGLGFGASMEEFGIEGVWIPLFGFNIGVELGQIIFIIPTTIFLLLISKTPIKDWFFKTLSWTLIIVALFWSYQRIV